MYTRKLEQKQNETKCKKATQQPTVWSFFLLEKIHWKNNNRKIIDTQSELFCMIDKIDGWMDGSSEKKKT